MAPGAGMALRPGQGPADTTGMRSARAIRAIGAVAVLSLGLVGASHPAWASDGGKKVQVKAVVSHKKAAHQKQYECVLKVGVAPHLTSKSADRDRDGDADDAPTRTTPRPPAGNVVVEIPPVTMARAHGKRLVVTTNTGEPPNGQDAIYYVSKGKGGLAPESIREQVLSGCTADSRR